jgi:hypothetical protein
MFGGGSRDVCEQRARARVNSTHLDAHACVRDDPRRPEKSLRPGGVGQYESEERTRAAASCVMTPRLGDTTHGEEDEQAYTFDNPLNRTPRRVAPWRERVWDRVLRS